MCNFLKKTEYVHSAGAQELSISGEEEEAG